MKKVVISGMIGNSLEWYDFALYGYFATIISQHFFPNSDPFISLIATYGAFAAGFLMRPFGAILFGYIGDKYGRKIALSISILMMAVPTALIGALPTYEQIGVLAPILLTLIRLLQGLSVGGEFSGSITFIVEHSKDHRRGIAGSMSIVSLVGGMLLGSAVATLTAEVFSKEDLYDWAWRIPFISGLLIGFVGYYIRHFTHESPKYAKIKEMGGLSSRPVRDAFKKHPKKMLTAIGLYMCVTVPFYTFSVFMITYYSKFVGGSFNEALKINTIGMALLLVIVPLAAWVSDKIGRKKVMAAGAIGYLIFFYPIFLLFQSGDFAYALIGQIIFAILLGIYTAPMPAVLVELFPTSIRYTGMAISYNICAAVFGGTVPMLATYLIQSTGIMSIVAFYLILCAVISLVTLYFFKDRYLHKID